MAAKKLYNAERDALVKEVRERVQDSHDHDKDNRREAALDLEYLAGNQWPYVVRREREAAGRPMLTFNRLGQFVRQVSNEIRQSDLSIKVIPEDDQSDPTLAKIYDGLIRYIQYTSSASHVFATAAEHQTACGIGWFRIESCYADDSAFDQELKIRPVRNPLSVYDDPSAIEIDRSDAMWRAIVEVWPRKAFEAKWPGKATDGVTKPSDTPFGVGGFFWSTTDTVRVAEYWRKIPYTKILGLTKTGETIDATGIPPAMHQMVGIVRTRKQECHRVEQYIVSGSEVLEGPHVWPGKHIPVIPVIGGETPLEQRTYRFGVIRQARDSQIMYNFMRTATAEAIAMQPKNPWLVTPEMVRGHESAWHTAHKTNRPFMYFNPDQRVPSGPRREAPPAYPAALVQEAQFASDDMKATTGIYDAALGARSNETAGVAIARRQVQGATANFHFIDNLSRSLEHAGRVLIDLIPKVYDNERVIRLLGDDGSQQHVPINRVMMGIDGQPVIINDLSVARFDIRVTIGKGASTKRVEAAEHMLEFIRVYPESGPLIADLIASNSDWPGAEEIAKRLKAMVPEQALADPNAPPPPPPPPAIAELEKTHQTTRKLAAEAEKIELENMAMYGVPPSMEMPEQPGEMPEPPGMMEGMEPPHPEGPMPAFPMAGPPMQGPPEDLPGFLPGAGPEPPPNPIG